MSEDEDDDPGAPADDAGADDAPLDDLVREVRAKQASREEGADASVDPETDLFEAVEVGEVDDEAVWEAFAEGEMGPEERVGVGADPEDASGDDEAVVPKREFCQRCPHFADPPETACTHEGTTIVEVVDADSFRVRNCPVVAEDRETASIE
ncbi:hypothetical protein [Haloplanus pelagicus]|jgi:hypothetical protein|uniref:hypothetical protein n=1 Tax=Haloplanus pelagicus TaxID=2949995 RepID=UPI0020421F93|nr:hypothetical protein [Haloplanus sp. HW8-1]